MENETTTTGADNATAEGAIAEAQSVVTEAKEIAQATEAAEKAPKVSDTDRLKDLVKKSKDAEKAESLTEDDLDFLEKHDFGNKPPKEEKKAKAEKAKEVETEAEEPEAEEAEENSPKLADLRKEVGAKTDAEILAKVKELRKGLTGKTAQDVTRLTKDVDTLTGRIRNEMKLFEDVRAGKPEALAHLEKAYGVRVVPAGNQEQPAKANLDTKGLIPRDKFIDEESADLVNGVISELRRELYEVRDDFKSERERVTKESRETQARIDTIDEMVKVSGLKGMEEIAKIPNLRKAVEDWYNGKDDPRFETFGKLFDTAKEKNCDLEMAWAWLRAQGYEIDIAQAEERGRKSAYEQKPTKSLSGIQGKGHQEYQTYTDAQLEEMSTDLSKCPEEWFDADDRPDHKKIPRRAHKFFFREGAKA